ncbi:SH3 domain-containing protein [Clostridium sp. 2218st1_F5_2218SCRN_220325]|uniref:C40 family peptidase n=1 Tax=Clostridium sp. 2218st1_F5_2218SCRN_220325 TaxID=3143056 RepID=UPI00319DF81F
MSINKSYVLAGAAIAATSIVSMTNISTVEAASQIATVTENVNFRTGPSTSYSSITVISKGSSIEVLSTSGNWVNAKYNGKTGYIYKDYVSNSTSTSETTQTTKYVNTTAGLNVRTGPSTSYAKIVTLSYGQSVNVLSTSNGWSKINYNGSTGYVSSQYLQSTKPSSSSSSETSQTVKYVNTTSGLNMRTGPATSYAKITTIAYGQSVNVLSTSNGWSKINYSGSTGYVSSQYLQSKKPSSSSSSNSGSTSVSSSASSVIAYAKTLLGKPYVWGAQGPNSFDCSGFTYYVFKNKAGIVLPRTSSAQSKYGTSVSWSNLKAGDLMFFDTNGANNGQVSHVGLYIGNGQMIHASSSQRKIVITSVNTSYYKNAFVNARRVL